jgi:hypothetical protein
MVTKTSAVRLALFLIAALTLDITRWEARGMTPNSPDVDTQSISQCKKNRYSLVVRLRSGGLTRHPQRATFNYVSPLTQTQFQAVCVLVKYHSNTGKVLI